MALGCKIASGAPYREWDAVVGNSRLDDVMGEIAVSYHTKDASISGRLLVETAGVTLDFGKDRSGFYSWDQVRRISFDDPGRTKASVGAIAIFGVLGLAARKAYSLITLSVTDQDLYFSSPNSIAQWRTSALRLAEDVPIAADRLYLEGRPVGAQSAPNNDNDDILDQVRRLGELHDSGVLTDDEFMAKKSELLARL